MCACVKYTGKSSLLRTIAGRQAADTPSTVHFNGVSAREAAASGVKMRRLANYAPQVDVHAPFLTVKETLAFADASCNSALPRDASTPALAAAAARVERIIAILGLKECENTIVGDNQVRGISGGQKKRVTIGEALLSGARILALDEITNGTCMGASQRPLSPTCICTNILHTHKHTCTPHSLTHLLPSSRLSPVCRFGLLHCPGHHSLLARLVSRLLPHSRRSPPGTHTRDVRGIRRRAAAG